MAKKYDGPVVRYEPALEYGLNTSQVEERIKFKLTNVSKNKNSKSYFRIFFDNIFTFFNLIWLIIFVALVAVRAYSDLLFAVVIVANTLIAIVQEIKAKITVEKLSLVTSPRINVIRNGQKDIVLSSKLVLDDIIELSTGNQIPADCVVLAGEAELNESLLTGESEPVKKQAGDRILAGSFIVSGVLTARVDALIKDSYIQSIAKEAKKFKKPNSNLFKDLNTITKYIGIIILPIAAALFASNYFAFNGDIAMTVTQTCGSLTGMVPAGMFLLVTIALALGVIKLSRKKTLVQDLYSIEMLSRTNMLCLDKTGTITDGTMNVASSTPLSEDFEEILKNILFAQDASNSTFDALLKHFGTEQSYSLVSKVPFSSSRKFSLTVFEDKGAFMLGAPEFVCKNIDKALQEQIDECTRQGERVLLLAKTNGNLEELEELKKSSTPLGFVSLQDHIRDDAIETISWFRHNNVQIKIISGDNPQTVSAIAKRVGVPEAEKCVSLEGKNLQEVAKMAKRFTVFGRVTPEQKHALIKALKNSGYVVAMTGDGVNDTLALKEADCSIAMADGSDVARGLSSLVLMDSKFSSLPAVVKEGRQVINNVQKSSTLFLMKTIFTIVLSCLTLLTALITLTPRPYPFSPSDLLPIEMLVIGLPSLLLALQPNDDLIKGDFIPTVLKKAFPSALLMLLNVFIVLILYETNVINAEQFGILKIVVLTLSGYLNLIRLCYPYNRLRTFIVILSGALITLMLTLVPVILPGFFGTDTGTVFSWEVLAVVAGVIAISLPLMIYSKKIENFFAPMFTKMTKNKNSKS